MDLWNWISNHYKNSSLQNKLFFSYFILIFAPIVILSFHSYYGSAKVITRQMTNVVDLYLSQAEEKLSTELSKMENVAMVLAQRGDIREILEKKDRVLSFREQYDDMQHLWESLSTMATIYQVHQVRLYVSDRFLYSKSNHATYSLSELEQTAWYRDLIDGYGTQLLLEPYPFRKPLQEEKQQISVVNVIRSFSDINDIIGVVFVDMLASDLMEIAGIADFSGSGMVLLLDQHGAPIVSSGNGDLSGEELGAVLGQMQADFPAGRGIEAGREDWVAGISAPVNAGWRIFSTASYGYMLQERRDSRNQQVILAIAVGVVAYILAYLYAWSNTKRIKLLAGQMKQVEQGHFNVTCMVDSADEIGDLQNSFNFMVRKVNILLQEQYEQGKSIRELEFKALQAQINPHFLYNTLDLISWRAKKNNATEIMDIVYKLACFYRISLSNGSDLIPLRDEFEHVRLYIQLQNLRFEQEVLLAMELPPDVADCTVLKLLLQPIVENSLIHGIRNLDGRQGEIRVSACRQGDEIRVNVRDNGRGIEKGTLMNILTHEKPRPITKRYGGFGLMNIMDRLQLHYNGQARLTIDSGPDGTVVAIHIPLPQAAQASPA